MAGENVWRIGPTPLGEHLPGRLGAGVLHLPIRGIAAVNGPCLIKMVALVRAGSARHRETRWSLAGTSGHGRRVRIAGHRAFTAATLDGEAAPALGSDPTSSAGG